MSKSISISAFKAMIIFSFLLVLGSFKLSAAFAGDLEPSAAPASTMYTLEEIHDFKVWKMSGLTFVDHPGNTRFAVCDVDDDSPGTTSDDLVLDKDTGLIWARDANLEEGTTDTESAPLTIREYDLGYRMGWRIPTVEELCSLIDTNAAGSPMLPAGHPFVNVQTNDYYGTDMTAAGVSIGFIYGVNFNDNSLDDGIGSGDFVYLWPVWGGKSIGY